MLCNFGASVRLLPVDRMAEWTWIRVCLDSAETANPNFAAKTKLTSVCFRCNRKDWFSGGEDSIHFAGDDDTL